MAKQSGDDVCRATGDVTHVLRQYKFVCENGNVMDFNPNFVVMGIKLEKAVNSSARFKNGTASEIRTKLRIHTVIAKVLPNSLS